MTVTCGMGLANSGTMFRVAALASLAFLPFVSHAENLGALPEVPMERLSDKAITAIGQKALAVRPADWKHAESDHFIYHFFDRPTASAVSVEAEFYYRVIADELGKDTRQWERKCHIFIFTEDEDWKQFQVGGGLDPWTGGIHSEGTLLYKRNAGWKDNNQTLPHEITHLVVHRFFGAGVPLWLHEGFAEYAASRCRAAFYRARGFNAKPRASVVAADRFIPVEKLTEAVTYPHDEPTVIAFYAESEKLVRFLSATDKTAFMDLFQGLGAGGKFESTFRRTFFRKYPTVAAMEEAFKPYATSAMALDPK